jgi:2',3'-cyclic-nucleotide 2'-phosphodiesterase (5'-nucleotidase family)
LHLPYEASLDVAKALDRVDYAIQAHEGRVSSTQLVGKTLLAAAGERGRQLGRAELALGTSGGPLFDRTEASSARQQLGFLEQTISKTKGALKARPEAAGRKGQERMLETLIKRRAELLAKMEAEAPPGRSSVLTELLTLDRRVAEDPEMARREIGRRRTRTDREHEAPPRRPAGG